jgi:hypothetical protein
MKYLKKFEKFHSTGLEDGKDEESPKYNPKIRKQVTDFVDDLTPNNRLLVFKTLGMDEPSLNDEEFDNQFEIAKKKFIDYFESNPQLSVDLINLDTFTIPNKGGDGIPRVQNIGGSSQANSFRIGQ